jgi:hypothetical protein
MTLLLWIAAIVTVTLAALVVILLSLGYGVVG